MSEPSIDESSDENGPPAKKVKIDSVFLPNDVILIVEDQRLHVNRDLLVSASPVFEAWLKKEWQGDQPTESGKVELSLPGKSLEQMTTLLKCLLPFDAETVSVYTLDTVLPLADEYQIKSLISECFQVIQRHIKSVFKGASTISPYQIVKYLQWFEQCKPDNNDIKTDLINVAACQTRGELEKIEGFDNIGQNFQMDMMRKRNELLEDFWMSSPCVIERKIHHEEPCDDLHHVYSYFVCKRRKKLYRI